MAAATPLLTLTLLCFVVAGGDAQQNVALQQPTWMLDTLSGWDGSKGVDGLTFLQNATARAHSSFNDEGRPYGPFWVVQLKRWVRFVATRLHWRNNSVDRRDVGSVHSIGPWWNTALTSGVLSANIPVDPIQDGGFSPLFTIRSSLYDLPGLNRWFNLTTTASGRYYVVQSPTGLCPVQVIEAEVYGEPNWLANATAAVFAADTSSYASYNWLQLTDEQESTCLTILDATVTRSVRLSYAATPTGRFVVAVLVNGSVQPQQRSNSCSSGTLLRVTRARQTDSSVAAAYSCVLSSSATSSGTKSFHTFVCDCSDCGTGFTVWLSRDVAAGATSVQLCEVLLFMY